MKTDDTVGKLAVFSIVSCASFPFLSLFCHRNYAFPLQTAWGGGRIPYGNPLFSRSAFPVTR